MKRAIQKTACYMVGLVGILGHPFLTKYISRAKGWDTSTDRLHRRIEGKYGSVELYRTKANRGDFDTEIERIERRIIFDQQNELATGLCIGIPSFLIGSMFLGVALQKRKTNKVKPKRNYQSVRMARKN
jgi:hypothetical protein